MQPSQEQLLAQLRILLGAIGTLLTTLGFVSADTWGVWTNIIFLSAGPLMLLGGIIWSLISNTQKSLVGKVDTIAKEPNSPVAGVIMTPTIAGRELADSIEGTTSVVAGTPAAATLAKPVSMQQGMKP